jgi:thioredoxin reductase
VLLIDEGKPRNRWATRLHGYLTRDGIDPGELLRLGREEIERYGIEFIAATVATARCEIPGNRVNDARIHFEVTLKDGRRFASRKLLLATGVRDILPDIENLETYYGKGVYHCPYCDGWEHRDKHLVSFGQGRDAVGSALGLLTWSPRVTACSNGEELSKKDRERLARHGVSVRTEKIVRLEGSSGPEGMLERIAFESGPPLECAALFFNTEHVQHSHLPLQLGCEIEQKNEIRTGERQGTGVPGLFLCGDADGDVQFVIVAAAEGATAAVAINHELQLEYLVS